MAEKFVPRHSVSSEINKKPDYSMFGRDFLRASGGGETEPRVGFNELNVDDILPRSINRYRQSRIEELALSIINTNNRLIHPIVVMRIEDLKPDSEVFMAYCDSNTDLSGYKYFIVSGERRYRAWRLLREREKASSIGRLGEVNPFDTITANVLTAEEAANEKAFYADANNQTRHFTAPEGVWFIRDALSEVATPAQKREFLVKLNGGSKDGIDIDPVIAAKKFRMDIYIRYLLDSEYGINDWSDATLRNLATVALNCTSPVCDALLAGTFPLRLARQIATLPHETQCSLLELYLSSPADFEKALVDYKAGTTKAQKKPTHADTRKQLKAALKRLKSEKDEFERIASGLGNKYNRNELDILKRYELFISDLNSLIEKTK